LRQFVDVSGAALGALMLAAVCGAVPAHAAADNWRFDTSSDGLVTASLHATNKLFTGGGALGYSPVLTIACRPGSEPGWSEWLQLNDPVSASRKITMSVNVVLVSTSWVWCTASRKCAAASLASVSARASSATTSGLVTARTLRCVDGLASATPSLHYAQQKSTSV